MGKASQLLLVVSIGAACGNSAQHGVFSQHCGGSYYDKALFSQGFSLNSSKASS